MMLITLVLAALFPVLATGKGGVFPLKPFEERNVELKSSSEFSKIWTPNSLSRGVSGYLEHSDGHNSPFKRFFSNSTMQLATYHLGDRIRAKMLQIQVKSSGKRNSTTTSRRNLLDLQQAMINSWATSGGYVVKVLVGSNKQEQRLIFDTGSSLVWMQCRCKSCRKPANAEWWFEPFKSKSYSTVKCNEKVCNTYEVSRRLSPQTCVKSRTASCPYSINYLIGSSSGTLVRDAVTLSFRNQKKFALRLTFGCQYSPLQLYSANGVLGAGRTGFSFPSQLRRYSGSDVFSTCFVDPFSKGSSNVFYGPMAVPKSGIKYTNVLTNTADAAKIFYYVRVTGVYVGGKKVRISSSAFRILRGKSYSGTFLDTGTSFAILTKSAWKPIFRAVQAMVKNAAYSEPIDDGYGGYYEPCWANSKKSLYPTISFVFNGGPTITLQPNDYIFAVGGSAVCNLIQRSSLGVNILGAMFMTDKLIVWDRGNNRIGIKAMNCATGKSLK